MRIGVANFPPFLFAGLRQTMAGVILGSFLILVNKIPLPPKKQIIQQAFAGFLMISIGNGFVSWGEVYVPSGLAAIICSLMPVWVTVINLTFNKTERPNFLVITGVLTGLAGIMLVFSEHIGDFANTRYTVGIVLIFLASVGWAVGSIIIKRTGQTHNAFLNAALQMFFGGLFCFVLSLFFDDLNTIKWSNETIYSLAYLTLVGSVIAFAMYAYILIKLPITIASLYSYVNPLVAVLLGWAILDEKLNAKIGVAIMVTVVGIYLVNKSYRKNLKI